MIPQRYIEQWKAVAPWTLDAQVEQDLVIARALVEIYSDDLLKQSLAFRGGTALHKLYLLPQIRYSEDIDTDKVIYCYKVHMENAVSKPPTQKQFLINMNDKMSDREFLEDIRLVLKQGVEYDNKAAWELVRSELMEKI